MLHRIGVEECLERRDDGHGIETTHGNAVAGEISPINPRRSERNRSNS